MNNNYYKRIKSYTTSGSLRGEWYDQGVSNTGFRKSKYHRTDVSWSIKTTVKGGNISIVYTMVSYKSNVMHVEDDTLNFSLMRQNINDYPK